MKKDISPSPHCLVVYISSLMYISLSSMMMSLIGEATPLSLKLAAFLYSAANRMHSVYGNLVPQSQVRREGEGREGGEILYISFL